MERSVIGSQLTSAQNESFRDVVGDIEIIAIAAGAPVNLPEAMRVLIAAPFRRPGGSLPQYPPHGWPFDLKWVQLISVGLDSYPAWLFEKVQVTSARGTSSAAMAEFALAAIFASAKRLPEVWISDPADWAPSPLGLVAGQTLGLFGFGGFGQLLARRALAMGMRVVALRRSLSALKAPGVDTASSLQDLVAQSDHLVLAAPSTPLTAGIINRNILARAKRGMHIINLARGALIDDEALLDALDNGHLSLATLDVTLPEPLPAGHAFYTHPKVRLSPHTCVYTPDTLPNLAREFAQNLARFQRGEPLAGIVDIQNGY
jgi:phosphoglycerate dehydrogenase-like enzyme